MSDFDQQVMQVVIRLLEDNGFEVRRKDDQNFNLIVNTVGSVCVLPPYLALYNFRSMQIGSVELSDPDSLEQFLVMMRKHQDLVKLGINRSRRAMTA